ncbi:MAG: 16S rRNA (guanine966-N2)-methyltransferase [Candidatus Endobugula sp.]|jgi:16S rRNA (guanine966-N2)-methyltransferase
MTRTNAKKNANQLRIIGGKWRGRKLTIADVEGLRPTGDRIRETLFNWLTGYIVDSHCVDLFAGSGALGMECLSRGAAKVTLVETNACAASQLRRHCQQLEVKNALVIEANVLTWLADSAISTPADIVFIDPPFDANLWASVIEQLETSGMLSPTAMLYIETPRDHLLTTPAHWTPLKDKHSGHVRYRLFQRQNT